MACVSGGLSTIDGTTCDIGNLRFTFTGLEGGKSISGTPWTDSDFTFTVLSNGFELSGPPPQTITAQILALDMVSLNYDVTDLNGVIFGLSVSGGNPFVSGPSASGDSEAENALSLCGSAGCGQQFLAENLLYDASGTIENGLGLYRSNGGPLASGFGFASPFELSA